MKTDKYSGNIDEFRPGSIDRTVIPDLKRRDLIKASLACGLGLSLMKPERALELFNGEKNEPKYEALHYEKLTNRKIQCRLCPKECVIDDRERGYCGVRENEGGTYYTLVHSKPCSLTPDPIEKKPFFHFMPGTLAFSTATVGCNMDCKYCQNWQISQLRPEHARNYDVKPEQMVELARNNDCISIAYTYSEPVIFYEYMYDISKIAQKQDVRNVVISNGYIMPKPMEEILPYLDAVKVDLKAFTEKFYNEVCAGELKPVLDTLKLIKKSGTWLEIVYLVVPTMNDSEQEIKEMSKWVFNELGPDVPVHYSRFYPQYRMKNLPPTPVKTIRRIADITEDAGIRYVYVGNVPGNEKGNTYCPQCEKMILRRIGYTISAKNIIDGKCGNCGKIIPGVWK
ncbi:MAG: AmmeMemoRadiSam system radical SAM enzyme [bacterium]|nr:AmmeMemoRadiSam system radical SAM enzyme [bacterium]